MRFVKLFLAAALIAAPVMLAPTSAYADGIERPRAPRPRPRPEPSPAPAPAPVILQEEGPETVTLSNAFFAGSNGGVGADIDGGDAHGSSIVVIRGGSSHAFAHASARASARSGGRASGGHGCGCR